MAAWNERDAKRWRVLVVKTWIDDGMYIDAHRRGVGHEGIGTMIKTAQGMYPGWVAYLVSGIEAHNGYVRFSWAAGGSPEAPLYLGGTDFAIVGEDGHLMVHPSAGARRSGARRRRGRRRSADRTARGWR